MMTYIVLMYLVSSVSICKDKKKTHMHEKMCPNC